MVKKILFISLALFGLLFSTMPAECFADATADLKQAETYQKAVNYKEAETIYKKIVTDYPETEYAFQAQKGLAILYINTNKDSQAQTAFQELVASFPQHPAMAEALYYIAKNFNWKNKHDKAHQIHQYNADNFSDDKYALWSQIEVTYFYIQSGDDAAAADASIDKLLTVFSNQHNVALALYQIGMKYQDVGKSYKAIELYRHVIETWPADKNTLFAQSGLAISYEASGDKNTAKAAYERLLADLTQHELTAEDIYWIAKRFNWAKQSNRAAGVHRYNVERFPGKEHALWSQVEVIFHRIRSGQESASDTEVDRFLSIFASHPALPRDVYNVAKEYDKAGRHRRADELYQYVLDNRPIDEDIYARMSASMAYMGLGDDANALAVTDSLIADFKDHPRLPTALHGIGNDYQEFEKYDDAEAVYRMVIQIDPNSEQAADVQGAIGWTYVERGLYDQAITEYGKVVENYPESKCAPNGQYWVAQCYYKKGDFEQAMIEYRKVIDMYPDSKQAGYAERKIAQIEGQREKTGCSPAQTEKQSKATEGSSGCGSSALVTLGYLLGINLNEQEIAALAGTDEQGITSMYGLAAAARAKGLKATGMKLGFEDLSRLGKPVIAFVAGGHFKVIKEVNQTGVVIADKQTGDTVMPESDFQKSWQGYILVVEKAA